MVQMYVHVCTMGVLPEIIIKPDLFILCDLAASKLLEQYKSYI